MSLASKIIKNFFKRLARRMVQSEPAVCLPMISQVMWCRWRYFQAWSCIKQPPPKSTIQAGPATAQKKHLHFLHKCRYINILCYFWLPLVITFTASKQSRCVWELKSLKYLLIKGLYLPSRVKSEGWPRVWPELIQKTQGTWVRNRS